MNNKIFKAGILIVLLVIPAFVFIFLKTFGENQFSLPYYIPETDEKGGIQIVNGDTVYYSVPDFRFVDLNNEGNKLSSLATKIKVLNFDRIASDSLSSISLFNIARVHDNFKKSEDISFLSLIDSTSFTLLKANRISTLIKRDWKYAYCHDKMYNDISNTIFGISIMKSEPETLLAPIFVVLLDDKNNIRGIYNSLDVNEIDRLKLEIKVLMDILEID